MQTMQICSVAVGHFYINLGLSASPEGQSPLLPSVFIHNVYFIFICVFLMYCVSLFHEPTKTSQWSFICILNIYPFPASNMLCVQYRNEQNEQILNMNRVRWIASGTSKIPSFSSPVTDIEQPVQPWCLVTYWLGDHWNLAKIGDTIMMR